MKKNLRRVSILMIIFCLFIPACTGASPKEDKEIKVGVTLYDKSDTFISEMNGILKNEFEKAAGNDVKITLSLRDSKGSQRMQNDQVNELIDEGCDILCINLVDRSDTSEIIDLARNNNIPVIFFNREPVLEDLMQWDKLFYVGSDARQSGTLQGELAAEAILNRPEADFNKDGIIQYVVIEGEPGHQDTIIRTESSVEAIEKKGIELEKISYQIANWNREQAQNRMTQLISQYQTTIELVLANNDEMALGVIEAYDKANITESSRPLVFGIDGTKEGIQAVRDGIITGSVYNDKEGQAGAIAGLAIALLKGDSPDGFDLSNGRCIYVKYRNI